MNHKKWAAAAIAAVVGLGMLGTALPASATGTGTADPSDITITGASVAGRSFKAYKIADYQKAWDGVDLISVTLGTDERILEDLKDWLQERETDSYDKSIDPLTWIAENWHGDSDVNGNGNGNGNGDSWHAVDMEADNVRALANWLAENLPEELEPVTAGPADPGDDLVIETTEGLWLVIETAATGQTTRSLPIIVGTKVLDDSDTVVAKLPGGFSQPAAKINVKGDLVEIDKDILGSISAADGYKTFIATPGDGADGYAEDSGFLSNAGGDAGNENEDEDSITVSTGDMVRFQISTNVPHYADTLEDATFKITDKFSKGLNPLLDDTLEVKVEGVDVDECTDEQGSTTPVTACYILTGPESGMFEITIRNPQAQNVSGKVLVVTYDAEVQSATEVWNAGETYTRDWNEAYVTFTNEWEVDDAGNPTDPTTPTGATEPDEVDIFTFPLDVRKADLNNTSKHLVADFIVLDDDRNVVGMIKTVESDDAVHITDVALVDSSTESVVGQRYSVENTYVAMNANALRGLAGDAWYQVLEHTVPNGYTILNKDVATFWVYISASGFNETTGASNGTPEYSVDALTVAKPMVTPDEPANVVTAYVQATSDSDSFAFDKTVLVLNAREAKDMPSTGGQILLIAGIAGVLGLGAITFGAVGLRKRKTLAAAAA